MESSVKESATAAPTETGGCFGNIFCFSGVFSLVTLIIDTLKPYMISQITALEKQFGLSSIRSGLLISCDEIGYLIFIFILSHCGRSRHIPRFLAGALFVYGISGISTGLLNLADPVTLPKADVQLELSNVSIQEGKLCQNTSHGSNDKCLSDDEDVGILQSNHQMVFILMAVIMVLKGAGKSPIKSLGVPYVDNNSRDKAQSSLLTGIITTVNFFGWTVALLVGGVFSNVPVDLSDSNLDRLHPEWIGAWWLGFLVFGGIAVIVVIPLILFPKYIKKQPTGDEVQKPATFKEEAKDLHKSIMRVLSKPAVVLLLFSEVCFFIFIGGSEPFLPKYIESQFWIPAYIVNIIVGIMFFVWGAVGVLSGGIITSKLNLTSKGCMKLNTVALCVATLLYSIALGLGCENQQVKGVGDSRFSMNSSTYCQCDEEFFPVCGSDNVMYSSPCVAGCHLQNGSRYSDCREIPGGEATAGWCERDCPYLIPYVAVDLISGLAGSITFVPVVITFMRLVEPRDKPMVMALTPFLNSIVGFLSGPIIYGSVIDSTCLLWQTNCGSIGACALYDLPLLRYRVKSLDLGLMVVGASGYLLNFLLMKYGIVSDETPV